MDENEDLKEQLAHLQITTQHPVKNVARNIGKIFGHEQPEKKEKKLKISNFLFGRNSEPEEQSMAKSQ